MSIYLERFNVSTVLFETNLYFMLVVFLSLLYGFFMLVLVPVYVVGTYIPYETILDKLSEYNRMYNYYCINSRKYLNLVSLHMLDFHNQDQI